MRRQTITAALLACGLLTTGSVLANPPSAEMLGFTCAACHGYDGASNGPATPSIAGMPTEYFVETMKAFKNGERPATVMDRIAKGYSDEEIGKLADYFAGKRPAPAAQSFDAALADKGKQVHEASCEKCHEDGGRKGDGSGVLAGQWMPYLKHAIIDFNGGHREMPKKMRANMKELSEKDFEALMHFYASQK